MTDAIEPQPAEEPSPKTGRLLAFAPRASWVAMAVGALVAGVAAWWGLLVEAIDWGRLDYGGPTERTMALLMVGTLAVPILAAFIAPLAAAGPMAVQRAINAPQASFARRFGPAVPRLIALVAGFVLLAALVGLLLVVVTNPIGEALRWGSGAFNMGALTPLSAAMWCALLFSIGTAAGLTGLALATVVAGVAMRP